MEAALDEQGSTEKPQPAERERILEQESRAGLLKKINRLEAELVQANARLDALATENSVLHEKLIQQAIRDPLTGLFNRGYLDETLTRELARADRDATPVSVIMLDLDHFKYVNDMHGHAAGDLVLKELGKLLRQQSRISDIVCRYGGEEFLALLPGMPLDVAIRRSEQWRSAVEGMRVTCEGNEVQVTVSIGIAMYDHHSDRDELLKSADKALYAAKDKGRNCVAVWVM